MSKKQKYVPILDISDKCKDKRVIVIGDLHGCFDDLQSLLDVCKFNHELDILILTGDLVDRGNKIKECLKFVRTTPNVYSVMGNHDEKFLRYLRRNKVNLGSMSQTLAQCDGYMDQALREWLETLPYIIKFDDNKYVVHAGINPNFPIDKQIKEFCLFARHFNKEKNNFSDQTAPMWWEVPNVGNEEIFFGHQVCGDIKAGQHHAMDGGACFGLELRAWMTGDKVAAVKATTSYADLYEYNQYVDNPLLIEDDYVKKGLLSKKESGDLVLYNYTQKCTCDGAWDEVTMRSRGVIYDKTTKEVVSYVPKKFFNLGENDFSHLNKLPTHLPFKVLEKVDGSMVTCSSHKGEWIVATRGSFESDQAKEAKKIIFEEKKYDLDKDTSYLFEVIYPENRISPGARLVCDYGPMRDVVLLTAFDKTREGLELTREELESEALWLNMPICKAFDFSLEKAIAMQKTLPFNEEGYVILFEDGTRVKIKGDEYIRMAKILNGMSPLSIWEAFDDFHVPQEYLNQLPEEIRPEAEEIAKKIYQKMDLSMFELKAFMMNQVPNIDKDKETWRKELGLWLKAAPLDPVMKKMVFPWVLADNKCIFKHIKEKARPTGNHLDE